MSETCRGCVGEVDIAECRYPHVDKRTCRREAKKDGMSEIDKDADEGCPPNKTYCEHGRIAGACYMCEVERELDLLRRQVEVLLARIAAKSEDEAINAIEGGLCDGCGAKDDNCYDGCADKLRAWSLAKVRGGW